MHNLRCSRSPGFPSISYCLMLQRVCHPHSKRKQIRKMPSLSTLEKRSGKSAFCLGTGAARWGCWYRVWEPCETSLDSLSLNRCRNVWWLPCWFLLMYLCVFLCEALTFVFLYWPVWAPPSILLKICSPSCLGPESFWRLWLWDRFESS